MEETIRVSDLSGQRIEDEEQLVHIEVSEHHDLPPGERRQLDALPAEVENLGKLSIAAVVLDVTHPGAEEPVRHVMTQPNFNKLAGPGKNMEDILAAAAVVNAVKQRRSSHNTTKDGGPLVNYNDPEYAGLPHKGRIGEQEAAFVRENLELVNQRRSEVGHWAIDPTNPQDAKRYGFETTDQG